tara:strand:- start:43902 stop:44009 length:108 start_codon:yes stop_codon:yes gene_type:complete
MLAVQKKPGISGMISKEGVKLGLSVVFYLKPLVVL